MEIEARGEFTAITDKLMTDFCLARLAKAKNVVAAVDDLERELLTLTDRGFSDEAVERKILTYSKFRDLLCTAGNQDLWGTPENEPTMQATQG